MAPRSIKLGSRSSKSRRSRKGIEWVEDKTVNQKIGELVNSIGLAYINPERVFCYKSYGAKTRAYARIWGLSRIFQQALVIEPAYVIEVISEKFDRLPQKDQDMILIHELLHIPRTFSGALVPHHDRGGVNEDRVREIYRNLRKVTR